MSLIDELITLQSHIEKLKKEIAKKDQALREKNLALDAMHFVWCNGCCNNGTHRWTEQNITEEIVREAELNTQRLRQWWTNERIKNGIS